MKRAGRPGGAIIKGRKVIIEPDVNMEETINSIKDLGLNPKSPTPVNISKINDTIRSTSEKQILPLLEKNNIQLADEAKESLINQIQSLKSTLATTPEQNALTERIKNIVVDSIIDSDTNLDLYLNRIKFDDVIGRELGQKYLSEEEAGLVNNIVRQIRRVINNAVAQNTSNPEEFNNLLNYEHNLFNARDILAKKGANEVGKKLWQIFLKNHPAIPKIVKIGAIGGGALYGLNKVKDFLGGTSGGGGSWKYNYPNY